MFVFIIIGIVLIVLGIFLFTGGVVCGEDSISRSALVEELMKIGYTSAASNELGNIFDKTGDGCISQADLDAYVAANINTRDLSDAWLNKYGVKSGLTDIFARLGSQKSAN